MGKRAVSYYGWLNCTIFSGFVGISILIDIPRPHNLLLDGFEGRRSGVKWDFFKGAYISFRCIEFGFTSIRHSSL